MPDQAPLEPFVDPFDGTRWLVDVDFLASSWECIWGRGCEGILERPAAELNQGCCSVGAELLDDDEARLVVALGASLNPERFQYWERAADGGLLATASTPSGRPATRVVDGACVFLNRPGFEGGAGCALHLGALDEGESPIDWKPSVCWQLPLKVVEADDGDRVLRRWSRADWGPEGADLAWCCTERPPDGDAGRSSAFAGDRPVAETLAEELTALVGREVSVAIRKHIDRGSSG